MPRTPNKSSQHFKLIFECVPVAIFEKDFSSLLKLKKSLMKEGVFKFRTYFRTHRKLLTNTYKSLKIVNVNKAAINLFEAKNKKQLISEFNKTLHTDSFSNILNISAGVYEGITQQALEFKCRTLAGKTFDAQVKISVPQEYEKTLKRVLITVEDISVQKKYERHLKRLAQTDGLTRVLNNGTAMERLQEEFLRAKRYKNDLSVMMIDMDHFKKINDVYGHQKGDSVLRNAATMIKANLREVDVIGRYGGDEFIAILPETPARSAKVAGERLRAIFEELSSNKVKTDIYSTVSVGICGISSKGVSTIKELIRTADRALYYAKTAGRNRVIVQ